ncbi:thiamine phosphate synthase [Dermabacteraceae bacterium P13115]
MKETVRARKNSAELWVSHCYLVTSGDGPDTVAAARSAAQAGVDVVQVRAKQLEARALYALTEQIARAVAEASPRTRVVVDDRVDVAAAAMRAGLHVHGVHVGQDDLPPRAARELLGPEALIGLTTGTLELVRAADADADVLDYLGAGPYRPTPTKNSGRPPLGVAGYPPLVAASSLPLVAIGDVRLEDVSELSATGIAAVAMVREVMSAPDPGAVVTGVQSAWRA